MPTPNNNNSITYFELALLAEDVYKENSENRGVNDGIQLTIKVKIHMTQVCKFKTTKR
ncbi:hypothetical protein BSPWISOXPB_3620 [uncultured Gammaproteobacteria bacterium]|nr:hypothetical protein BSPWISOXPB_3620 [uncultured Gammaproteobacteria bacterium]